MVQDVGGTILGEISPFPWGFRQYKYKKSTRQKCEGTKKRNRKVPVPLGNACFILLEVALQHTLQSNAMASLVTK